MSERAPYSRVYWSVMHDPKFDDIRHDCRAMGAWLILLLQADMSWPSPAYLPRHIPKSALVSLANARIIELLSSHRYRIVGLDAERERRKAAATREARGHQPGPNRDPVGFEVPGLSKDETRKDETSNAREPNPWEDAWYLTGRRRPPTDKQRGVIDRYLSVMDRTGPERLARLFLENPDDPIGAAMRDIDAFREERKAAALVAEQEAANRPRIVRGKSSPTRIGEVA